MNICTTNDRSLNAEPCRRFVDEPAVDHRCRTGPFHSVLCRLWLESFLFFLFFFYFLFIYLFILTNNKLNTSKKWQKTKKKKSHINWEESSRLKANSEVDTCGPFFLFLSLLFPYSFVFFCFCFCFFFPWVKGHSQNQTKHKRDVEKKFIFN